MELANIVPESDSARCIVRHGAEVARVEEDCCIVRNLVADADSLIRLKDVALRVGDSNQGVDVLENANVAVDIVEHQATGLNCCLELGLRSVHVDSELAVILLVRVGLVHGAARGRAGHPVHETVLTEAGNAGIVVRHLAADFDNALIVRELLVGIEVEDNGLELRADLVAEALCVVDIQLDSGRVVGRAAESIEAVAFKLIERRLMSRSICRAVRTTGERGLCGRGESRSSLPRYEVVILERSCRSHGLRIEESRIVVEADVEETGVISVRRNNHIELVAGNAGTLRRAVSASGLSASAVQAIGVEGLRILEELAQRQQSVVSVRMTENLEAVLLEVAARHGKDRAVRTPVQHKRHGRVTSVRESSGRLSHAGKVDIRAGEYLVLYCPDSTAKGHIISPCLS